MKYGEPSTKLNIIHVFQPFVLFDKETVECSKLQFKYCFPKRERDGFL